MPRDVGPKFFAKGKLRGVTPFEGFVNVSIKVYHRIIMLYVQRKVDMKICLI
jgi:hypothetical protein